MINAKAVLFDFDGVLADTEGSYTDFWTDIDNLYPTGVPDFAQAIKGSVLERILTDNFPAPEVRADIRRRLEIFEQSMPIRLFDGALQLLNKLRTKHIPVAIVTSSPPEKMQRAFESNPGLRQAVDVLITDADVTKGKPNPQCYLLGAARLGIPAKSCAVVEDSINGLRAARAANACCVIALATTNPADAVSPLADVVFPHIASLKGVFAN